jgi:nucleoredoxin
MSTPLEELIGRHVVNNKKEQIAVKSIADSKQVVGLYFSAHWCPPCRGFTPQLAVFYEDLKEANESQLEVVFVSSDRDEASWAEYFGEMPWLALPFNDRDTKSKLAGMYEVTGIPTLVIVDAKTAQVITKEGRKKVMTEPKNFPWK